METGDMATEPFIVFHLLPLAHLVNVSLPGQARPLAERSRLLLGWTVARLVDQARRSLGLALAWLGAPAAACA
jgi:hypothetical protein